MLSQVSGSLAAQACVTACFKPACIPLGKLKVAPKRRSPAPLNHNAANAQNIRNCAYPSPSQTTTLCLKYNKHDTNSLSMFSFSKRCTCRDITKIKNTISPSILTGKDLNFGRVPRSQGLDSCSNDRREGRWEMPPS